MISITTPHPTPASTQARIIEPDKRSEAANTFKERFLKYREKLFEFLGHDGVAWNNNYGEHAIKTFAHYRVRSDGNVNESGLNAYLTLLSVHQTCKNKRIGLLGFLLSRSRFRDSMAYLPACTAARWPISGRHILAQFDDQSVIILQAYRPAIGHFAAKNGFFGGEFSLNPMSWIKPIPAFPFSRRLPGDLRGFYGPVELEHTVRRSIPGGCDGCYRRGCLGPDPIAPSHHRTDGEYHFDLR